MMKYLSLLLVFLLAPHLFAQQNSFIDEYLERLENSKQYLILVAENMPELNYKISV